ncbi:MAG: hypothetical protein IJW71_04410 [Clostridia bacterium]|nr:hypothetical protein [Clostridia bacterium]
MKRQRVVYYKDELNDEFSTAEITPRRIDGNYRYLPTAWYKGLTHFFWYRIVATPLAFLYTKIVLHHKIVGKKKLRAHTKSKGGCFLYGNHTQIIGDALIPSMLTLPGDAYVIVHPNNVSMPYLGRITPSLGALPLPDDMAAYRNFIKAVATRIEQGHSVFIYPEAHIWPFYTGIRNFPDTSFYYPIKCGVPAFAFTNTYQKRRLSQKPRIVTYIDGPFYPDAELPPAAQKAELRDRVYDAMCRRAALSDTAWIEYRKVEEKNG